MKNDLANGMTGVAGEYAVAMELSKRGFSATRKFSGDNEF